MSIIEIKHRFTGAVLWSGNAESLGDAVEKAVVAKFSLARANLAGADLARASTGRVPHFYASNNRALEDIKRCAKEDEQEFVAK